jgi:hypothetical protein
VWPNQRRRIKARTERSYAARTDCEPSALPAGEEASGKQHALFRSQEMNEEREQKIRRADRANTESDRLQKSKRGTMKTR